MEENNALNLRELTRGGEVPDEDHGVTFQEFLGAALRLRGDAKSKDLLACFFN